MSKRKHRKDLPSFGFVTKKKKKKKKKEKKKKKKNENSK